MELSDRELIELYRNDDENAKEILFQKYNYIIETEIHKYYVICTRCGIEYSEIYQEAVVGFSDALKRYEDGKEMILSSFITLCVDRRLRFYISKFTTLKNRINNDMLSLEYTYERASSPLADLISDNNENNPLDNMVKEEHYEELREKIESSLSNSETQVYKLMVNGFKYNEIALLLDKSSKQIDNATQRIKAKINKILEEM